MKPGRPTKFNAEISAKIVELAYKGKTLVQISEILDISIRTLYFWRKENPNLLHALNEARQAADELVEASLYHRACGYSHKEEKIFCFEGNIITHETIKHYPPDPTSMIFWLKNRQPKKWRDKLDIGSEEDNEKSKELKKMSINQLLTLVNTKEEK
jgi:hypothetical protein